MGFSQVCLLSYQLSIIQAFTELCINLHAFCKCSHRQLYRPVCRSRSSGSCLSSPTLCWPTLWETTSPLFMTMIDLSTFNAMQACQLPKSMQRLLQSLLPICCYMSVLLENPAWVRELHKMTKHRFVTRNYWCALHALQLNHPFSIVSVAGVSCRNLPCKQAL